MNLKQVFTKKPNKEKITRDLLRENLKLVSLDMFYLDDPITDLTPEQRVLYLKFFYDLYNSKEFFERIKYHINKQAHKTLGTAEDGVQDVAGAMNINGMAFIMDDVERLAKMYMKENQKPEEKPLDKFSIIPKVG